MEINLVRQIQRNIISLAILVLITACSGNETPNAPLPMLLPPGGSSSNDAVPNEYCDNPLFPVKQNASWTHYSNGGPNGDFSYTDTITGILPDGFILTSQFPTLTLTQNWICSPEGYIAQQLGGGTTASVSMQNMISDFQTLQVSGLSLPRTITPGMQWHYDLSMQGSVAMPGEQTQSPGTFSLNMQELGTESVTTLAGTFDATKLQAEFIANIDVDFQGSPIRYTINGTSILWYAPGVGFIKSIENIDFSGTSFTSTTELQSYNIP
ncbi:MAG: hypothetical protein HYZ22_17745 [Chloroflexi bacterium]|nr:hypothetical protein [Chloroflexota bacterium]